MSQSLIPDGEYDLDISCLAVSSNSYQAKQEQQRMEETFSIRYGFLPDSMDPTKPLTIYKMLDEDNRYAIKAPSLDESQDIFLEGVALGGTQPGLASEYAMIYEDGHFVLKPVHGSIRASKSRNPKTLDTKAREMERSTGTSPKKEKLPLSKASHQKVSLKRLPSAASTPSPAQEEEEVIIHDSDFDDLDFQFDDDSKLVIDEKARAPLAPKIEVATPQSPLRHELKSSPTLPVATPGSRPVLTVASKRLLSSNIPTPDFHSDDEFGDIENELEQVLQESSDEDEFKMEIDEGAKVHEKPRAAAVQLDTSRNVGGPISLRGLSANGRRKEEEDMSSSEEE
ncbi:hypothetical protein BABINDRAFT_163698 [Babjeviella inositovora NRRL Y-12698]|uniref:Transcription elongation factor Eaf N-terminal domain-containing protein n=1 Tax=Babjeviella inositovora NRRL Y-12698 TaxID=984486 RepID=A0A1E3QHL8_9ASCO|nr:uncharacterized protein BABINDRAFT_163698 [Babjeviella inositovora NRRL Y-12698]ODQ77189.1 hypothetical protein BABINDRAFT_163698 [Babjeviella inositovora NRRL Y-12698]